MLGGLLVLLGRRAEVKVAIKHELTSPYDYGPA
jgi:hypothetical protein